MKVKKGDTVTVISGRHKGKTGIIIAVNRAKQTVHIEGIEMTKCFKPKEKEQSKIGSINQPIFFSKIKVIVNKK